MKSLIAFTLLAAAWAGSAAAQENRDRALEELRRDHERRIEEMQKKFAEERERMQSEMRRRMEELQRGARPEPPRGEERGPRVPQPPPAPRAQERPQPAPRGGEPRGIEPLIRELSERVERLAREVEELKRGGGRGFEPPGRERVEKFQYEFHVPPGRAMEPGQKLPYPKIAPPMKGKGPGMDCACHGKCKDCHKAPPGREKEEKKEKEKKEKGEKKGKKSDD